MSHICHIFSMGIFLLNLSLRKSVWIARKHISRQNSVNYKKQILQQNNVTCDKTPHNLSTFSTDFFKFLMWRIFPHNNLSCGELLHLTICHVDKFLHMIRFSPRCPWQIWGMHTNQKPQTGSLRFSSAFLRTARKDCVNFEFWISMCFHSALTNDESLVKWSPSGLTVKNWLFEIRQKVVEATATMLENQADASCKASSQAALIQNYFLKMRSDFCDKFRKLSLPAKSNTLKKNIFI